MVKGTKRRCPHCGRVVYETDPVCSSCGTACRTFILCEVCGLKTGHDLAVHQRQLDYAGTWSMSLKVVV